MTVTQTKACEAKTFDHLKGLDGISDVTLEQHLKLYNGYVNNTNTLIEKLSSGVSGPEYAELKRRLGFEVNGVVLHELYFDNLKAGGGSLGSDTALYKKLAEQYGSYEKWEEDFKTTGKMRGIGWVVLYQCPKTGMLVNFWISDHEYGHPAGFNPILVMDVWEHAFALDFKPTGKGDYIGAFFKNIDWDVVASRLK